jgi:hypothetical protein
MGCHCRESKNDPSVVYLAAYCTDYAIPDRLRARYYQNSNLFDIFQCRYQIPHLIADWSKYFWMKIKPSLKLIAARTPISYIRVRDDRREVTWPRKLCVHFKQQRRVHETKTQEPPSVSANVWQRSANLETLYPLPHYLQSIMRLSCHTVRGTTPVRTSNWVRTGQLEVRFPARIFC